MLSRIIQFNWYVSIIVKPPDLIRKPPARGASFLQQPLGHAGQNGKILISCLFLLTAGQSAHLSQGVLLHGIKGALYEVFKNLPCDKGF